MSGAHYSDSICKLIVWVVKSAQGEEIFTATHLAPERPASYVYVALLGSIVILLSCHSPFLKFPAVGAG